MAESFKYGNGVWATKEGSSLAYNDENDNYKPLPFSVTRDSIATRVNKEGLIEVVGKDKLRIDYTDTSKGVALLEPARTNLITYSEDFTQWTKINGGTGSLPVVTSNNIISPDGTQNADKIVFDNGNPTSNSDFSLIRLDYGGVDINGTASVYLKSDVNVDIEISSDDVNYQIVSITTQWQRFNVSDATSDRLSIGLRGTEPNTQNATIYAWGAQLEAGSYATSYIPTSGSAVPRAADVANGAGNSEVFNDSEGVLFADIAALADDLTFRVISVSDGVENAVRIRYRNTSNFVNGLIRTPGTTYSNVSFKVHDIRLFSKTALKYKSGDVSFWVNGFKTTSSATFSLSGLSKVNFDQSDGGNDFYGKAKRIGYFDAVLTDAELEALTSYTSFTNMANELNLTIK